MLLRWGSRVTDQGHKGALRHQCGGHSHLSAGNPEADGSGRRTWPHCGYEQVFRLLNEINQSIDLLKVFGVVLKVLTHQSNKKYMTVHCLLIRNN